MMITSIRILLTITGLLLLQGCVGSYPAYAPSRMANPYYAPQTMPYGGYNYNAYPAITTPIYGGGREFRDYGRFREHEREEHEEHEHEFWHR